MKLAVRYYTKSGNTKKLADAIAGVIGVKAKTLDVNIEHDTDILFLGSSVYGAGVDQKVKDFITNINPNIKKVVCFSTATILKSSYSQVIKLLSERNIKVDEREFHCRGSFTIMHKGRPNIKDIADAEKFTREILKDIVK
jgi:flavodoxin